MKTQKIMTTLMALTVLALPAASFAANYQYVDTAGRLQSVEAPNAAVALATATNIDPHSGVILGYVGATGGSYESVTIGTSGSYYQYVDVFGHLQTVEASSPTAAIAKAYNIDPHSGVILVTDSTKLTR